VADDRLHSCAELAFIPTLARLWRHLCRKQRHTDSLIFKDLLKSARDIARASRSWTKFALDTCDPGGFGQTPG
jgi:hypothetical protein